MSTNYMEELVDRGLCCGERLPGLPKSEQLNGKRMGYPRLVSQQITKICTPVFIIFDRGREQVIQFPLYVWGMTRSKGAGKESRRFGSQGSSRAGAITLRELLT